MTTEAEKIIKQLELKYMKKMPSYKKGFQAGENSKHKSDLQQELKFLNGLDKNINHMSKSTRKRVEIRINLIKKELEEIGK